VRAGSLGRTGGAASPAGGGNQPAGFVTSDLFGLALVLPDSDVHRVSSPVSEPLPDVP
jgi:hypothetical protein